MSGTAHFHVVNIYDEHEIGFVVEVHAWPALGNQFETGFLYLFMAELLPEHSAVFVTVKSLFESDYRAFHFMHLRCP